MEENGNTKVKQEAEEQGTPIIRIPRKSSNDWAEEINNKGLQIRELETKNNDMRKLMVKAKESISGLQKRNKEKDEIIGKQEIEIRKYRELIDTLVATDGGKVRKMEYGVCLEDQKWYFCSMNDNSKRWYKDSSIRDIDNIQNIPELIDIIKNNNKVKELESELNKIVVQYENRIQRINKMLDESEKMKRKYYNNLAEYKLKTEEKEKLQEVFLKEIITKSSEIYNSITNIDQIDFLSNEEMILDILFEQKTEILLIVRTRTEDFLLLQIRDLIFNIFKLITNSLQQYYESQNNTKAIHEKYKEQIHNLNNVYESEKESKCQLEEDITGHIIENENLTRNSEFERKRIISNYDEKLQKLENYLQEKNDLGQLREMLFKLFTTYDFQEQEIYLEELYPLVDFDERQLQNIKEFREKSQKSSLFSIFNLGK